MSTSVARRPLVRGAIISAVLFCGLYLLSQSRQRVESAATSTPSAVRKVSDYFRFGGGDVPPVKVRNAWLDLETEMQWTKVAGGIEGYYTFSNMYLSGGALVSVVPSSDALSELPAPRSVLSGSDGKGGRPPPGEELWTQIVGEELAISEFGKRVVRLPGITYLFNDQPGPAGYLPFFEHFVPEIFVPAARSAAAALGNEGIANEDMLPSRIIFPRHTASPSWRDGKGLNRWLLANMLPATVIEDSTQWNDRAAGNIAYVFDHLVIVDRGGAHSAGGDTSRWGKMNANAPKLAAPKDFFEPFRQSMMTAVGSKLTHIGRHQLPVVVLIERESEPRIADAAFRSIVSKLRQLTGRAEIHISKMKSMTSDEKVALLSRTDILVSLTGDDLLQMMWMKAGGSVIEIFEGGGFARDFEVAAELLNHNHIVVRKDEILTREKWSEHPLGQRGPQKDGLVDVDADVVVQAIVEALDSISRPPDGGLD